MGSSLSKGIIAEESPYGIPDDLYTKIMGPHLGTFSHWTIITQHGLQLNWPTWSSFEIPNLVYLHSQLEKDYKLNHLNGKYILISISEASKHISAVPNLFGTRDWFCGR